VAKEALIDEFEQRYIRAALEANDGNLTKAARRAGIDRMYLHRLVQKHGAAARHSSPGAEPGSPPSRKPVP
jgi:DNA-binding NtrC family response regulator